MSTTIGPKISVVDFISDGATYGDVGRAFLRMFQALIQPNVINMTTSTPPSVPGNGDTYVVDPPGSGAWVGKDNYIAYWTTDDPNTPSGKWDFYQPLTGWIIGNQADQTAYIFNGSTWTAIGGSGTADVIKRKTTITSAQIKNLGTTTIEVIPAPGLNKVTVPINYTLQMKFGTTPYANNGADFVIACNTGGNQYVFHDFGSLAAGLLASESYISTSPGDGGVPADIQTSIMSNQAFYIGNNSGHGTDPTLGDGTWILTMVYYVADLT